MKVVPRKGKVGKWHHLCMVYEKSTRSITLRHVQPVVLLVDDVRIMIRDAISPELNLGRCSLWQYNYNINCVFIYNYSKPAYANLLPIVAWSVSHLSQGAFVGSGWTALKVRRWCRGWAEEDRGQIQAPHTRWRGNRQATGGDCECRGKITGHTFEMGGV